MGQKFLMKGNEAIAEAAIRNGCIHFFGYPITPQTEVSAYMSKVLPKIGGTFLQAESEIAAINMVLGASSCGVRLRPAVRHFKRHARRTRTWRHSAVAVRLLAGDKGVRTR